VIYNADEFGFWPENDRKWIVMLEPSGLHLEARTLKIAREMMADAAINLDEYFEPEAVELNSRREDVTVEVTYGREANYAVGQTVDVTVDPGQQRDAWATYSEAVNAAVDAYDKACTKAGRRFLEHRNHAICNLQIEKARKAYEKALDAAWDKYTAHK
jgi:hypothetical protein